MADFVAFSIRLAVYFNLLSLIWLSFLLYSRFYFKRCCDSTDVGFDTALFATCYERKTRRWCDAANYRSHDLRARALLATANKGHTVQAPPKLDQAAADKRIQRPN